MKFEPGDLFYNTYYYGSQEDPIILTFLEEYRTTNGDLMGKFLWIEKNMVLDLYIDWDDLGRVFQKIDICNEI
jgi:hypothetical protein